LTIRARPRLTRNLQHEERENAIARERLAEFDRTGEYIADEDVDAWLKSWGTANELPMPTQVRRVRRA
jgi:predicted transcriptional regulator